MRKMFSKGQIKELVQQAINSGDIDVATELIGKYVRIMDAPSSTTLSNEQVNQIIEGVFINGSFLGLSNPVLFPAQYNEGGNDYRGYLTSIDQYGRMLIKTYNINSSKVISTTEAIVISPTGQTTIANLGSVNSKSIPSYPSSTGSFTLKCVDGVLTWVEDLS